MKEAEKFEGLSVFYSVTNKDIFKGKNLSIFGGGDSALDWALELSKISNVTLIHRREEFRGAPHTLSQIKKLEKQKKISIKTPYQLVGIDGGNSLNSITIKSDDGKTEKIETNIILSFLDLL